MHWSALPHYQLAYVCTKWFPLQGAVTNLNLNMGAEVSRGNAEPLEQLFPKIETLQKHGNIA